jgi:putative endonuclease
MLNRRRVLGAEGEKAAEKFLRRRRYAILQRNFRCKAGEIDLIALHRRVVVFIEVKTRSQDSFGNPLEAVDKRKQRQVVRAARYFIAQHGLHEREARFDVVGVWWEKGSVHCELVENAFEIEG